MQSLSNLVWLDLEMTGLDAETQVIIQAAVVITDSNLNSLDEYSCDIWQPTEALKNMSPFVQDMHNANGLLERVHESRVDLADAERNLMKVITRWCPFGATLCGNSIWADRRFIDRYMPGLSRYLGYRMVDVSSLKVLAAQWYGEDVVFRKPAAGAHDALVDIRNSVAELQHYRQTLFQKS